MKERALIVSIGNSTCRAAVMEGNDKLASFCLSKEAIAEGAFRQQLIRFENEYAIERAGICSVVPSLTSQASYEIGEIFDIRTIILTAAYANWFQIHYKPVDALGMDRLCNVVALRERYGYPGIVMDLGTATTFNVLDDRGNFSGGMISVGIETGLRALHASGALLPLVHPKQQAPFIGQSTHENLVAGTLWPAVTLLESLRAHVEKQWKKAPVVIVTGGNASLIMNLVGEGVILEPDLCLFGARILLDSRY